MQDNIHEDALAKLALGVRKTAKIVLATMGPKGNNVLIQSKLSPGHRLTNDGATIIKAMELADPIESMGLGFLKEAVDRSNANSGDGSTTTVALLNSILNEGIKTGINSLELKLSLDACLPIVEQSLYEQTRQITVDDIPAVATIAGENEELAGTLGEIYKTIGKDGIIHLEGSGTFNTSYALIEGVRFGDTGFLSPYMANQGKKSIYEKPTILVTKNKIQHINDINPLLAALEQQGKKDLVIFTDDMDSGVARILIEAHQKGVLNILIIKAPILWKSYVFEDFAKCVGATIIEDASGTKLGKEMKLSWLGTCDKIIVDKEETTIMGIADISEHIKDLETDGSKDAKLRLSWLTTKTAILKLGAKSETELSYLLLKIEDAVHSSRLSLKSGVVAGGGVALFNASRSLGELSGTIGGKILRTALEAPIRQITANAGHNPDDIVASINVPFNDRGFNAKTGKIENLEQAGIIDSAAIVLGAIRNALGIASTLLTTSSVITIPPPSAEEIMNKAVMRPVGF